jgi:hypothetical protein
MLVWQSFGDEMFCRIFTCVIGPVCRPIDKGKIGWHISQGRWSACLIAEAMPKQSGNGQAKKKKQKMHLFVNKS